MEKKQRHILQEKRTSARTLKAMQQIVIINFFILNIPYLHMNKHAFFLPRIINIVLFFRFVENNISFCTNFYTTDSGESTSTKSVKY